MEHEEAQIKKDQLDQHSLPGTNQAGKGPNAPEPPDETAEPHRGSADEQLDKHSLPGTNQAGKGPGSDEKDDRTAG